MIYNEPLVMVYSRLNLYSTISSISIYIDFQESENRHFLESIGIGNGQIFVSGIWELITPGFRELMVKAPPQPKNIFY